MPLPVIDRPPIPTPEVAYPNISNARLYTANVLRAFAYGGALTVTGLIVGNQVDENQTANYDAAVVDVEAQRPFAIAEAEEDVAYSEQQANEANLTMGLEPDCLELLRATGPAGTGNTDLDYGMADVFYNEWWRCGYQTDPFQILDSLEAVY